MSVSGDLKRFLYVSATLNLAETHFAKLLAHVHARCRSLAVDKVRVDELLALIRDYVKFLTPSARPIDSVAFLLASLSKSVKDEDSAHKIYETLIQTSATPLSLFAFEYYRSFLSAFEKETAAVAAAGGVPAASTSNSDSAMVVAEATTNAVAAAANKKDRRIGRGHKKALVRWYTSKSELELLSLVTKYKHSHSWTNKDLLKLIHIKPRNEGIDFVMKYIMFGFEKIKNDKLPDQFAYLSAFVQDLENLKSAKTSEEINDLIRKNKFHKDHLPSRIYKFKEIWPALIEQMNMQEFCANLSRFIYKDALNTELERFIMDKILNKDSQDFKSISPISLCLAVQTIDNALMASHSSSSSSSLGVANPLNHNHNHHRFPHHHHHHHHHNKHSTTTNKQDSTMTTTSLQQSTTHRSILERLRDHLWHLYSHSMQNPSSGSKQNLRVMIVIEVNGSMRNAHTLGTYTHLNPIDASACVMLTLYYANAEPTNVTVFAASDKLSQLELADQQTQAKPDLATIERLFQGFASIEKNPTDKIFEWSLQNARSYDAFVFLTGSDQNYKQILSETEFYRIHHSPTTKLVLINLTGKSDSPNSAELQTTINESSNLNLCMTGWSVDHFLVLDSFLKGKF